eukprot:TRINITY_DN80204_c0_g1_i1.p2 TRINITY_DN80204_c0_g1~~TRINITY_DN80204_c0_g1_i1.p2  ORF type:complete len:169 (-),score=24.36 TRINITY_DN80204_c0_g1_i1:303-809(-)
MSSMSAGDEKSAKSLRCVSITIAAGSSCMLYLYSTGSHQQEEMFRIDRIVCSLALLLSVISFAASRGEHFQCLCFCYATVGVVQIICCVFSGVGFVGALMAVVDGISGDEKGSSSPAALLSFLSFSATMLTVSLCAAVFTCAAAYQAEAVSRSLDPSANTSQPTHGEV